MRALLLLLFITTGCFIQAQRSNTTPVNSKALEQYVYSKPDSLIAIADALIEGTVKNSDVKTHAEIVLLKARAYIAMANYFAAQQLLEGAIAYQTNNNKLQTIEGGKLLAQYARTLTLLEQMDEAWQVFLQARDLIEKHGTAEDKAQLYLDEAEFNRMRNQHVQYEACLKKAWAQVVKCNKPAVYARYYNRYASLKTSMIQLDSSLYFSNLAIKYAKQVGDLNTVGWSLNEIAFVKENQSPKAPNGYFLQSAAVFLQTGNMQGYTHTLMNYTRYLIANKRHKEALATMDTCRKYVERGDQYLNERTKLYGHYSHYYRDLNRYDSGLYYYQLHMDERFKQHDRLLSDKISYHQARYDSVASQQALDKQTRKLQAEQANARQRTTQRNTIIAIAIALLLLVSVLAIAAQRLRKTNKQLNKVTQEVKDYNVQLIKSLEYEQILLREVHHRVKNNLQLIISLLELGSDNAQADTLPDTVGRIRSIGMVHEMVHRHENLAELELQPYAQQLYNAVARSSHRGGKANATINLGTTKVGLEQAIPIGIILNEFFTNAWKYVYPHTKQMHIGLTLTCTNNHCLLTYTDNGPGLPTGVTFEKSTGMGLFLIHSMVVQLKGTLHYQYNNGMQVEIGFSINQTAGE